MKRHEHSVLVNRPIDEVWAFLTDLFNVPRFGVDALGVRQTTPGPVGVGTTYEGRTAILGVETQVRATVTEWDPPQTAVYSGRGAGLRSFSLRQTLQATAEGTKVVREFEFEPGTALKLLWWIVWPFLRRRLDAAPGNIKRLLEAGRG